MTEKKDQQENLPTNDEKEAAASSNAPSAKQEKGYTPSSGPGGDVLDEEELSRSVPQIVIGGVIGAILALLLFALFNGGSVIFDNRMADLEEVVVPTLEAREADLTNQVTEMEAELGRFSGMEERLQESEAQAEELRQSQEAILGELDSLEEQATTLQGAIDSLGSRTGALEEYASGADERMGTIEEDVAQLQEDTAQFSGFLQGLRDLLLMPDEELDAADVTPTPPSEDAVEDETAATPEPVETPEPTPTITPSSTATDG